MTHELLIALLGFAFVTSVTPGPNNMMLLASGVNFGFRRTVPHMLGISIGHSLMVFLVGLGLAGVFKAWPPALVMLKVASVAYMLWLAWKIAHAGAPGEGTARARPFSFLQAAAFQWVNPKAWAMALGAVVGLCDRAFGLGLCGGGGGLCGGEPAVGVGLGRGGAGDAALAGDACAAAGLQLDDGGASGAVALAGGDAGDLSCSSRPRPSVATCSQRSARRSALRIICSRWGSRSRSNSARALRPWFW